MKKIVFSVSIPLASLNRGDFKIKALLFLVAFTGFSCTDHENPLALISPPAGKANVDSGSGECLAISWSCDTEVDSVWTVFYGSDYRFQAHGERVLFSHYLDSTSKRQYWASETSTRFGRGFGRVSGQVMERVVSGAKPSTMIPLLCGSIKGMWTTCIEIRLMPYILYPKAMCSILSPLCKQRGRCATATF